MDDIYNCIDLLIVSGYNVHEVDEIFPVFFFRVTFRDKHIFFQQMSPLW